MFGNDFSNASALFELAGGGSMRINEFRRVGYPSHLRESRFRYFGTEASFEQLALVSVWQDKQAVTDISEQLEPPRPRWTRTTRRWPTSPRPCATPSSPAGPRARRRPAAGGVPRRCPTGTRAATTSWWTTSSPPSTPAPCRRSTPGKPPATRCPASWRTSPPSAAASGCRCRTSATPPSGCRARNSTRKAPPVNPAVAWSLCRTRPPPPGPRSPAKTWPGWRGSAPPSSAMW